MPDQPVDTPNDKRQLAAIVAADVVGYSKMMEADEREALKRVRDFRSGLMQPKVAEHHGRIFKTMGDGFLVEFSSVVDAVHCAVDIQRALAARNLDLPDSQRLILRVGINLGDVFHEGDDVFGDGVNLAARLEALAPPGGICVSRSVREQIREKLNFEFVDLGEHQVKNISRPIQVFSINIDGQPTKAAVAPRKQAAGRRPRKMMIAAGLAILLSLAGFATFYSMSAIQRPVAWSTEDRRMSFAVLPFTTADISPKLKEINDNLLEDLPQILAENASVGWVLPKAQILGTDLSGSPQQIGKRLNVAFVIQGKTTQEGDNCITQVSLIEVSSGKILGTEKLQRPLQISRTTAEDYAANVTRSLVATALKAEAQHLVVVPEGQWDARDWLISKWARGENSSKEFYKDSLRRANKALALAPSVPLVLAEAGAAHAFMLAMGFSDDPTVERREAQELLRKALNADSTNAKAWMGMSFLYDTENDWENAAMADEKVLAQWPHNASLWQNLAGDYANLGREKEAIALTNRKRSETFNFYDYNNLGFAYFVLGDLPAAESNFRKARGFYLQDDLKNNQNAAQVEIYLASTLARMGRIDDAKATLQRVATLPDYVSVQTVKKSLGKRLPPGTDALLDGLRKAGLPN